MAKDNDFGWDAEKKSFVFRMMDMALRDLKTGQAYATILKL